MKLESPTEVTKLSVEAGVKPAQKTPAKEEVKAKAVTESRKVIKVAGEEYSLEEISSTGSFFDELN